MITEWINTQENVPHIFIGNADDALKLAKLSRPDGLPGLWAMLDPTGTQFPFQPYVQPKPHSWPPVYPPWDVNNVIVGGRTLAEWFAPPSTLPGVLPPVTHSIVTATVSPAVHWTVTADPDTEIPRRETIYRLIIDMAPGRIDTGATYPGCSRDNQAACVPIQFSTMEEALAYAAANGETPVIVPDADTAWGMVEGTIPIPSPGISPTMLGLGAAAVLALLMWRRKK